jgi:GntR family transcriptional regulator
MVGILVRLTERALVPRPPAKAQTIAQAIEGQIAAGEMAEGTWLPSERELAATHGVDRSTIRRALQALDQRGVVVVRAGKGTQVREPDRVPRETGDVLGRVGSWRGFHVSAAGAGREPYTDTDIAEVDLDSTTARWLGVPTGTRVLQRARVQGLVGDAPVQLSTTWILPEVADRVPILRELDTGPGGMLTRMEEAGYRLRFEDVVSCRLPAPTEQDKLELAPDHPVLDVWRRCYDQHDRVVEVTNRVIAGGRNELIYRYDANT